MTPRILHQDASWLALDKPSGMLTTGPSSAQTLVDVARALAPRAAVHHPISRLDAEVTGVVLIALSQASTLAAEAERAKGTYERLYLGLAHPPPAEARGAWTWPVSIDPRRRTLRTTEAGLEPQEARTEHATIAASGGVALVAFKPVTGRTHQIRVHARAAGSPLVGDVTYGGARRVVLDDGTVVGARRVMLHAWRVRVPGRKWRIESPPPEDFLAVWASAGASVETLSTWDEGTLTGTFARD